MKDLHTIAETFRVMGQCIESARADEPGGSGTHGMLSFFYDPHKEADEWIAASESERQHLRALAEVRHEAIIRDRAHCSSSSSAQRLAAKAEAQRQWRMANPAVYKARQLAWRRANREYLRECSREYRERVKADPVRRESYVEYNKSKMRALRALWKSDPTTYAAELENEKRLRRESARRRSARWKSDPEKYAEEIRAYRERENARMRRMNARLRDDPAMAARREAKRIANREYQRANPVKRSPEEMQRRRDYYRAKYHENKAKKAA